MAECRRTSSRQVIWCSLSRPVPLEARRAAQETRPRDRFSSYPMTNQATLTALVGAAVRLIVKDPVPGTAFATAIAPAAVCSVAMTMLDVVTPAKVTVTFVLCAATVAMPLREKATLPTTLRASPDVLFANTPVPVSLAPSTPIAPVVPCPRTPMPAAFPEPPLTPYLAPLPATPVSPEPNTPDPVPLPCTPISPEPN